MNFRGVVIMSRPKVSVVMPTLDEQDALELVVADIRSHTKDYWASCAME